MAIFIILAICIWSISYVDDGYNLSEEDPKLQKRDLPGEYTKPTLKQQTDILTSPSLVRKGVSEG